MTEIEILAQGAIKNIERKNTKDANILLVNLYRTVQDTHLAYKQLMIMLLLAKVLHLCYVINSQMTLTHYKQYPV